MWGVTKKVVVSREEALGFSQGRRKKSCGISRSKTCRIKEFLVSSVKQGPIHQHSEHERVTICLCWPSQ